MNQDVESGSWRGTEGEPLKSSPVVAEKPVPYSSDRLVGIYRKFTERYVMPGFVLYPCCEYDISPSSVFSDVMYLDTNHGAIDDLRKAGKKAYAVDATKSDPQRRIDLLILLNSQLRPDQIIDPNLKNLIKGSYVIANNYHHTADQLIQRRDFEFLEELETGSTVYHDVEESLASTIGFSSGYYFLFRMI